MISKADTIYYLATETDPEHANVVGFIHAGCQAKQGSLQQWLHHPTIQEPVEWTPVTANGVQFYTAHPPIQQFIAKNSDPIYYLKPPDGSFAKRGRPRLDPASEATAVVPQQGGGRPLSCRESCVRRPRPRPW